MINITQTWIDHFASPEIENSINHFYLDGEGIVTVGIGCVVDPQKLGEFAMYRKADNGLASMQEIGNEYSAIRQLPADREADFYAPFCALYMMPADVVTLFSERLTEIMTDIEAQTGPMENYPDAAQLGMADMGLNLGPTKLRNKFPTYMSDFIAKDWPGCAAECHRLPPVPESRNAWTAAQFKSLVVGMV